MLLQFMSIGMSPCIFHFLTETYVIASMFILFRHIVLVFSPCFYYYHHVNFVFLQNLIAKLCSFFYSFHQFQRTGKVFFWKLLLPARQAGQNQIWRRSKSTFGDFQKVRSLRIPEFWPPPFPLFIFKRIPQGTLVLARIPPLPIKFYTCEI